MIRFKHLLVRNFKAITGPHELLLDRQGLVVVTGENLLSQASDSNGASKTALLISAPCWALFGKTEDQHVAAGKIQNRFAKGPVVVELEFEDDTGESFTLTRERQKNVEHVKLVGRHGKLYDPKLQIEPLLRSDYRLWTSVIIFGANLVDRFTRAPDSDRKAVFEQIIPDLERLATLYDFVDEDLKQILGKLERSAESLRSLEDQRATYRKTIGDIEAQALARHEQQTQQLLAFFLEQQALEGQYLDLLGIVSMAFQQRRRYEEQKAKLPLVEMLDEKIKKAEGYCQVRIGKIRSMLDQIEQADRESDTFLLLDQCPTCERSFSAEDRITIRYRLGDKRIQRLKQLDDEYDALHQLQEHRLGSRRELIELINRVGFSKTIDDYYAQLSELEHTSRVDERLRELTTLRTAIETLNHREVHRIPSRKSGIASLHEQETALSERLETLRRQTVSLEVERRIVEFWHTALGNKGIKSLLLDGVEGYLDDRLRYYSQRLTAGEVTIGFSSRTKLKKKNLYRDVISITAEHLYGAGELDLHSSGERQRIDLAVVLALQDLARAQRKCEVNLSLFDEVMDHLDETGCDRFMHLLLDDRQTRGSIFVISQNPRLLTYPADHQLKIQRSRKGTTVFYDEQEV